MALSPQNPNPLLDFVSPSVSAAMSNDGLIINNVYAVTGVLDRIPQQSTTRLNAPEIGILNNPMIPAVPGLHSPNNEGWIGTYDSGGSPNQTVLTLTLANPTWFNYLSLQWYDVPFQWAIYYQPLNSGTNLLQLSDFNSDLIGGINPGNAELVLTYNSFVNTSSLFGSAWNLYQYKLAPLQTTQLVITASRNIPTTIVPAAISQNFTSLTYPLGIRNFSIGLTVEEWDDVPPLDKPETVQSALGFTEQCILQQFTGGAIHHQLMSSQILSTTSTSGTFQLWWNNLNTTTLLYNCTATQIQRALQALSGIGTVVCTDLGYNPATDTLASAPILIQIYGSNTGVIYQALS